MPTLIFIFVIVIAVIIYSTYDSKKAKKQREATIERRRGYLQSRFPNANTIVMPKSNYSSYNNSSSVTHTWKCDSCGSMISENPCPYCNNNTQSKESSAPFWCGKCGKEGPYDGNCPNCGSSLKKYNIKP